VKVISSFILRTDEKQLPSRLGPREKIFPEVNFFDRHASKLQNRLQSAHQRVKGGDPQLQTELQGDRQYRGIDEHGLRGYALKMDEVSEKIILAQIREGNDVNFETLVTAHSSRIIGLAWRMVGNRDDAEDIAQEAFIRLYRDVANFRGDSTVSTWLYRTVSRLAIDHLRRQKLRQKIFFFRNNNEEQDPLELVADPAATPGERYLAGEAGRQLAKAMEKLSARQRAVFTLRHQEEMPLKEIAAMLELEEGTIKAHLHRAVRVLRKELKDLHGGLS
jgi:RNA polymerase sigma-70 factor (ECF subfamily)